MPIPGTKKLRYLEENIAAAKVNLSSADLTKLDKVIPHGAAAGMRYPEATMARING